MRTPGFGTVLAVALACLLVFVLAVALVSGGVHWVLQLGGPLSLPTQEGGAYLRAGTYASNAVGPKITFELDDGWTALEVPDRTFQLAREGTDPYSTITVMQFDRFVYEGRCATRQLGFIGESPETLLGWVHEQDRHLVPHGSPEPVEVGGLSGFGLDFAVRGAACPADRPLRLIQHGGQPYELERYQRARIIALEAGEHTIVIAIATFSSSDFGPFLEEAEAVLETMTIEVGRQAQTGAVEPPPLNFVALARD